MSFYTEKQLSIFFGDMQHSFIPTDFKNVTSQEMLTKAPFANLLDRSKLDKLFFLHQVHGTAGMMIHAAHEISPVGCFSRDGDYLITQEPTIGLAVATADCLPIVFYDEIQKVIAIAHAGWRGSVNGIAQKVVDELKQHYNTDVEDLKIFFGPSAKSCCYQVGPEFKELIAPFMLPERVLKYRNGKLFFDVPAFNQGILQNTGVPPTAFSMVYNLCTLCNERFCSVRRQPGTLYRQMSIVALRPSP